MSEFEKKSERIEIRVSHSKKQAFNAACEQGGDTPSGALRRFIDSYIHRADGDALSYGMRALGRILKRQWFPIGVMAAMLLVGGYFTGKAFKPALQDGPIVTASTEAFPPINYELFAAYDKNANGVLDLGEVADNDAHLHRVLNLDGEAGISPAEFYEEGKMSWRYIQTGSVKTGQGEDGIAVITKDLTEQPALIVEFDLRTPSNVKLIVREAEKILMDENNNAKVKTWPRLKAFFGVTVSEKARHQELSDRTVAWEKNKTAPALSFSNHGYRERRPQPS